MLGDLLAGALEDAAARRETRPLTQVEAEALARPAALDALSALAPADRVKIIAEVKRSSPSRGALAEIPDPALLASRYETGGASAISVLTEGRKFRGSLQDLEQVRDTVSIPVLRKDFIGEPYQVLEARASGADLVLLIVAALDQKTLVELHALVGELGMTALVETHSAEEVSRALDLGAQVVGVNARNLTTFELDRDLFGSLADSIPAGVVRIAESAVTTADDVAHYRRAGADVVLVGEALVTGDPVRTLSEFLDIRA
ncbi:indole-3-glycerol phosphate synthase TrpC [Clavibacter michiganensis]|uniref:indole-3-glycerol-phosphate synthase n=3 Tax=Clavibacter michiganensis subsp. insidiosus TaxID=33014 RepID=A0A0D5CHE3_9MICO|nr:indole-3-glycerol phosphate synthase TrpC [Clavibacter michiganensis]AJW79093.1 indole-3-glycerol phosphate synthase [Clavibacter michiganensis subsp. insidiosus]AWF98211.1 indole-3-glycerol-phosphate synthase [Clavibacter michiganensis subsp. insidiosus]AWG01588.1 indole-3-glycerol-phosphate synthase [Clavibacter michiganensis subsp. insidiosus]OQJ59884.1 indole-3-glycerol phosphate synthase [Clavibacter michiganensis subsp. insidiosus]RII89145.1 indole-3-glycerol phosphate synthase TrpC [